MHGEEEKMLIGTLVTGEEIHRYQKSIVVNFAGKRKTISTSRVNGGIRGDLSAVYNNDGTSGAGMASQLKAPTYEEHIVVLCRELGLDPEKTAGIGTAAQMENVSIKTNSYKDITVTAVVTGGVETNGGRVGDPTTYDELAKKHVDPSSGTINIMMFISVNLTDGALARALVTCTEAKTAALQELDAPSKYSRGVATGSGTDSTTIVCNSESVITLVDAGKHGKLGELIGKTVKPAVKEALKLQTGLSPLTQRNALNRVSRFGVTPESIWNRLGIQGPCGVMKARFAQELEDIAAQGLIASGVGLYARLLDEFEWGLVTIGNAYRYANLLMGEMGMDSLGEDMAANADSLISALEAGLAKLVSNKLGKTEEQ
ncbi:MAG: adenosylcobinamide amidohydrolase [Eubacteriaceae bacterium]|nr:adenosylcobinamide amidohydrolase [Eubacteriaceae bacterium]